MEDGSQSSSYLAAITFNNLLTSSATQFTFLVTDGAYMINPPRTKRGGATTIVKLTFFMGMESNNQGQMCAKSCWLLPYDQGITKDIYTIL